MNNDLRGEISVLKELVEVQRCLIDDLGSQLINLKIDHANTNFQIGGLRHWQGEMMKLRVDRGASVIDLTEEDSEDEVVEIPGFPDHHLLEEWKEVPTPGMVGIASLVLVI